jgi:hypothetical protein
MPLAGVGVGRFFYEHSGQHLYYGKLHPKTELILTDRDGCCRLDIPFGDQKFSVVYLTRKGRPLDTGGRYETWTIAPGAVKELEPVTVRDYGGE